MSDHDRHPSLVIEEPENTGFVQHNDFHSAANNWAKCVGRAAGNHIRDPDFKKFLGWDTEQLRWLTPDPQDYRVAVPERLVNLFHAMAGPHCATIIKAWEIKNANKDTVHTGSGSGT